jgi:diguanylate cyclase (GGDEF)-like protein/PAS domain S-box-containing protein
MINYKLLFETLVDGVFVAQDYQFVYCNSALLDMLGYKNHEFIGLHFNQIVSPDYLNIWTEQFERRIGSGKEPDNCYEVQFLRSDGKLMWVEIRATRSEFNNRPAVLGIIRNITERNEILNALILSQYVIDHSSIEVYQIDSDGHIQYANPKACQSMGYTAEEILNLSIPDIDPKVQHDQWIAHWQDLLKFNSVFIETTHILKDGTQRPVEVSANYVRFEGKEYNFAFVRDISERKQAYSALVNNEAILSATIEGSLDGVIHIDSEGIINRWNTQSEKIFGWSSDEVIGHPLDEIIIPIRYRDGHKRGMKHFLATGEGPVLNSRIEMSALHRDGHEFPIELSIASINLDGNYQFSAFISDLTERNLAKEKLIASEKRLRTIIDTEPESVSLISADGLIVEINSAGLNMLEAESVEQILDLSIYSLIVKENRQSFINLNKKVFSNESGSLEFQLIGLKGGMRWLETHVSPLTDLTGNVIAMLGITRDITLRKLSEERVGRLTALYKALSEINQAIVRIENESQLFPLVCRCAVEYGGARMAWIGRLDPDTLFISPVESYGQGLGYLDGIVISANESIPQGRGPVGQAVRGGKPIIVNDFLNSIEYLPWQTQGVKFGWSSVGAFPILRGGNSFGILVVYQTESNVFDKEVIELFNEMSADISFALDNFDRKAKLQTDEKALNLAASIYKVSSEAMLIIDIERLVIAINPAFTLITGYLENEILGKSVDILRTNYHDEAFYQSISDELNFKGKWQGELWFNRKDGEAYPTLAVINSVFDTDGSVLRQVFLFNDISQKKETEDFIWRQANYDLLTGLPNRLMFQDRVEQEFKKSHRTKLSFALLFLDLDNFKEVNDTLGHAYGDMLLKEVSQRILTCVRETDTIARFGGDEFTILLCDISEKERVNRVIEDILQSLTKPFEINDEMLYITASVGVTCYPEDGEDLETLTKNADQAMYAAKNAGRNGYSYFTKSMQETAQAQMRMANDLRLALNENQFWVAFQPIINLKSRKIVKAEALVRWQHPIFGLVNPADFIPIAEQTGVINDIGEFVFTQATNHVKLLQDIYDKDFQISVNVSPVQFNNTRAKYGAWRKKFHNLGLNGKSIVVEITEGLLLEANNLTKEKLVEFSNAGIQIAIDDFGTGYSSLSYLKKFEIDYIKIDQSFVRNMTANSGDFALCEAMVVMAHKLGIEVIAEGVETQEQSKLLTEMGCDFAQGYYFAKPMQENVFLEWLKNFKSLPSS